MAQPPPSSTLFPYTTLFRSLLAARVVAGELAERPLGADVVGHDLALEHDLVARRDRQAVKLALDHLERPAARSEEHTSELQSRRDLVCRLLLEKKKREKEPP